MDECWAFMGPWCEVLKERIHHVMPEREGEVWDVRKRLLRVRIPKRRNVVEIAAAGRSTKFHNTQEDDAEFQKRFQKTQDALALLSAVAHVNSKAWRFLLERECGVNFGVEGEERYEEEIPARFWLLMDVEGRESEGSFDSDLVRFCGVEQFSNPSEEYLEALAKVADVGDKMRTSGPKVDVEIPVYVRYEAKQGESTKLLKDIWRAEQVIQEQWEGYNESGEETRAVDTRPLRCTFVLEPMQADFINCLIRPEMAETIDQLVLNNVWFSQFFLRVYWGNEGEVDERTVKRLIGQLLARVFDNTRRSPGLANTSYCSDVKALCRDMQPLQLGSVHLDCTVCPTVDFEAMCSAIVVNQTTKKLSIKLDMDPDMPDKTQRWWKWMAYAFFSKRARRCSTLESLALITIGSMSVEDMEGFLAIVTAEHPEEELFDCPRGLVDERDATLKAGAAIRWQFDEDGEPILPTEDLIFDSPIQLVRTFSDNGSSTWVNVLVPGFGRCHVQREDLEFHQAGSSVEVTFGCRLTTLQLGFSEEEGHIWEGLPNFLTEVGPSLIFLGMDYHEGDLGFILSKCPNLQELTFCGGLILARLNFADYHLTGEPLPELNYDWHNPEELSSGLSDRKSPLSRVVRRLRIRLNIWLNGHTNARGVYFEQRNEAYVNALLKMLEVVHGMEYFDVFLHRDQHESSADFRNHHLKPMNQPLHPLSIESKLALISAVSLARTRAIKLQCTKNVLTQRGLDQYVLSKIFDFAAPPVQRQVFVRKCVEDELRDRREEELI